MFAKSLWLITGEFLPCFFRFHLSCTSYLDVLYNVRLIDYDKRRECFPSAMPKRISIAKHLTIEQLEQYYRQAKDGVESRQYQIIWLLAQGKKTLEVEEITGYSRTWIYALDISKK